MQGKLQKVYRVSKEIAQNSLFEGSIQLSQLPRLSSLVIPHETEISLRFEFATSLFELPSIRGHIDTELQLECQRCLEPVSQIIDADFDLLIDATDDDVQAFQQDTVYSDEGYLNVFEVIEDELILSLPLIAMHDEITCNPYWQPEVEQLQAVTKENPFAVLKSLKEKT